MLRQLTKSLRPKAITLSPYPTSITRHPIFMRDARRIWWGYSEADLRRYSRRIFWRTQIVVTFIWLGLSLLLLLSAPAYAQSSYLLLMRSVNVLVLLFGIMLLMSLGLDFSCVNHATKNMHHEIDSQRWDLLRLTALNAPGIALSKHAIVSLQSWRVMSVIISGRIATLWLMLVAYFILPLLLVGDNSPLHFFLRGLRDAPLQNILVMLAFLFVASIYVIEPLWRMKAMTAVGMMVSTAVRDRSLVALGSFGMILTVWLLQAIILVSLSMGFAFAAPLFFFNSVVMSHLVLGLILGIAALTIRGFYVLLENWAIRRVIRRIARDK